MPQGTSEPQTLNDLLRARGLTPLPTGQDTTSPSTPSPTEALTLADLIRNRPGQIDTDDVDAGHPGFGALQTTLGIISLASFIPHPVTVGVGRAASAGYTGLQAYQGVQAAREGDYAEAGGHGLWAALGLVPLLSTLRRVAGSTAAAEVAEAAQTAARSGRAAQAARAARAAGGGASGTARTRRAAKPVTDVVARSTQPARRRAAKPDMPAAPATPTTPATPAAPAADAEAVAQRDLRILTQRVIQALREPRLRMRALTRAGQPIPEDLLVRAAEAEELAAQLGSETARRLIALGAKGAARQAKTAASITDAAQKVAGGTKTAKATKVAAAAPIQRVLSNLTAGSERIRKVDPKAADELDRVLKKVTESVKRTKLTGKQKKAAEDLGFVTAEILARLAGAGIGATVGAQAGADFRPENSERTPAQFAAGGAVAGAILGGLGGAALPNLLRGDTKAVLNQFRGYQFFSLLSSPVSLGRATMGSVAAVFTKAAERIGEQRITAALRGLRQFANDIVPVGGKGADRVPIWFRALTAEDPAVFLPRDARKLLREAARVPILGRGIQSWPARVIVAADVVSTRALMAMGYSRNEALRANLSGHPQSQVAQGFLRLLGERVETEVRTRSGRVAKRTLKPLAFDSPAGQLVARLLFPFARVVAAVPEQAVKHFPGVNMLPMARRAFADVPGGMTPLRTAATRGVLGTGAIASGAAAADVVSPEFDPTIVAAGGPLAGLVGLGLGMTRSLQADQPISTGVGTQLREIPLIGEQVPSTFGLERVIPAGLRQAAIAIDPAFGREKGASALARQSAEQGENNTPITQLLQDYLKAGVAERTPFLREGLPEREVPVDVFGRPLYPTDRPAFIPDITLRGDFNFPDVVAPKFATSTPLINPPIFPKDDPLAQSLRRLQKETGQFGSFGVPGRASLPQSLKEVYELTGQTLPEIPREIRRGLVRARGAAPERGLEALFNSEVFQQLPPNTQRLIVNEMIERTRADVADELSDFALAAASTSDPAVQKALNTAIQQYIAAVRRR